MGFWIFILICNSLVPLTMIIVGAITLKKPPKEINGIMGYRTTMSMKNADTWQFANKLCGKIFFKWGWLVLAATVIAMLPIIGRDEDTIATWGVILTAVQMLPFLIPIFIVERALRKRFDKDGNRIEIFSDDD